MGSRETREDKIVREPPQCLFLYLNRTDLHGKKIQTQVTASDYLTVNYYSDDTAAHADVAPAQTAEYKLVGVVDHRGRSMSGGHYVAHRKVDRDSWQTINDERVQATRLNAADHTLFAYMRMREEEKTS
jgi:ubiquitin carboxyl-terminal hydrolase 10